MLYVVCCIRKSKISRLMSGQSHQSISQNVELRGQLCVTRWQLTPPLHPDNSYLT